MNWTFPPLYPGLWPYSEVHIFRIGFYLRFESDTHSHANPVGKRLCVLSLGPLHIKIVDVSHGRHPRLPLSGVSHRSKRIIKKKKRTRKKATHQKTRPQNVRSFRISRRGGDDEGTFLTNAVLQRVDRIRRIKYSTARTTSKRASRGGIGAARKARAQIISACRRGDRAFIAVLR